MDFFFFLHFVSVRSDGVGRICGFDIGGTGLYRLGIDRNPSIDLLLLLLHEVCSASNLFIHSMHIPRKRTIVSIIPSSYHHIFKHLCPSYNGSLDLNPPLNVPKTSSNFGRPPILASTIAKVTAKNAHLAPTPPSVLTRSATEGPTV